MKNVNDQNASTSTTPKAPTTDETKRELTDDEIASVAGGAVPVTGPGPVASNPPIAKPQPILGSNPNSPSAT